MTDDGTIVLRDNGGDRNRYRIEALFGNSNPVWDADDAKLVFLVGQRASVSIWQTEDHALTLTLAEARKLYEWLGPELRLRENWEAANREAREKHDMVREAARTMAEEPSPQWIKNNFAAVEKGFKAWERKQAAAKKRRLKRTKEAPR